MITPLIIVTLLLAQETDADRLKRLEETVRKQQEQIDKLSQPKKPDSDIKASFTDGLRFKSGDGNFDMHIGGRFQEHYRHIFDRPEASRTTADTFSARAARLQVDGALWKDWGYQVQYDIASSSTGSAATLQAAFLEWRHLSEFRLLLGQFKAPQSQDSLCSARFTEFIERPILARFVAGYEIGAMAHGKLAEGAFGYQVAVTNGRSHLADQGRGRTDDNDEKELTARLTASPWIADKESPFKGLRVGVYGSIGDVDNVTLAGATTTTFDIQTAELGVTFLDTTAGFLDGDRTRLGLELSFAWQSWGLRAEFLQREDEMLGGAVRVDVTTKAWYAALSWIVTGEDKTFETRITPASPFDITEGNWGAVEVAFRIAAVEVGDEIERIGNSFAGQSDGVRSMTLGVSWWPVKNVRISLDVIREDYGATIAFGNGVDEDALLGILLRFQIDM